MRRGALLWLTIVAACVAAPPPCPTAQQSSSAPLPALPPTTSAAPSAAELAPASDPAALATLVLPIPARRQAAESPPSGWCGETAIQEGLLHLGAWAPQRFINKAGRPVHPDLYSNEIPAALAKLGVAFTVYSPRRAGFTAFEQWVRGALDHGDPVLAGVKILPTAHPGWGLDHFVLVVGYGASGLLVNTTWGTRQWVADTSTPGLSFKNALYAIRLRGRRLPKDAQPARLAVLEEKSAVVSLRAECSGLRSGTSYRVERRSNPVDPVPTWSEDVTASSARIEMDLTVDADGPAGFDCVPVTGS
jgi:hypothetical protein